MSNGEGATVNSYLQYYPPGVKRVLASGGYAWIGEDTERLEAEKKLLETIGPHERIIACKGYADEGIYLERAVNGNLAKYILEPESSESNHKTALLPSVRQRLAWCRETAEAVAYIHSRRVLHCDNQPTNLLLDENLHIKLSDFQGRLLSADGKTILVDGWSTESTRFSAPRDDIFDADVKTDLFALGCTFYFIMMGHAVYPDVVSGEEGWHGEVEGRFRRGEFPRDEHVCSAVVMKCWRMEYESAEEVVRDLEGLEREQEEGTARLDGHT